MNDKAIKKKETAIVAQSASPMAALEMALNHDLDIDKLSKILDLQERYEKMEAKKAYTQAMADFKADPPKINKDKTVAFNQTKYSHASLGNVTEQINKGLAEHGLTAAWKTKQEQTMITVTCTITHKMGYGESTSLTAGADNSGKKNSIQALGSTISYLQRYTILSLTGLATHDMDDDGHKAEVKYITEKQVSEITDMIIEYVENETDFFKWLGVESVETIPASAYGKTISTLKQLKDTK